MNKAPAPVDIDIFEQPLYRGQAIETFAGFYFLQRFCNMYMDRTVDICSSAIVSSERSTYKLLCRNGAQAVKGYPRFHIAVFPAPQGGIQ